MKTLALTLAASLAASLAPAGLALAAGLSDMDADGSGTLSLAELQSAYATLTEEGFTAIDTNADGAVDEAELTAAVAAGTLKTEG
jgi:hypothetical protein